MSLAPAAPRGLPPDLIAPLDRLDRVLRVAVAAAEGWYGVAPGADGFRGLYLDRADVLAELDRPPADWPDGAPDGAPPEPGSAATGLLFASEASAETSRLAWLASTYRLSPFEMDVLVLALAPEVDTRYERAYAYLQDDVTKRLPTVELALRLLCASPGERMRRRAALEVDAPLVRHRLVRVDVPERGSRLAGALRVDEQVTFLLLSIARLDPRLTGLVQRCAPGVPDREALAEGRHDLLRRAVEEMTRGRRASLRLLLSGPQGSGKRSLAAAVARRVGQPMLALDAELLAARRPGPDGYREAVHVAFREAWLQGAALYVSGVDPGDRAGAGERRQILLDEAREHAGLVALASETPWQAPPGSLPGLLPVALQPPGPAVRERLWRDALSVEGIAGSGAAVRELAERFALTPGQIVDGAAAAGVRLGGCEAANADGGEARDALFAAARAQGGHALERYADRVEPANAWEDLVLPEDSVAQLREVCARAANRHTVLSAWGFGGRLSRGRGVTALFSGPSGTGKSMAAEVLAGALGVDLFIIDLAGVISKYIGETEQNLDRVFTAAEHANGVLFFDEADALFGKRSEVKDAHDRYANIEISYLLQKMERYEGVAVLATNLRDNLDDAFVRRLAFSIHFPFPDTPSRLRIWRGVWPAAAPLDPDVDFHALAASVQLSGGNIRNVALAAAHLAAEAGETIGLPHIVRGIRREYQKIGKSVSEPEVLSKLAASTNGAPGTAGVAAR